MTPEQRKCLHDLCLENVFHSDCPDPDKRKRMTREDILEYHKQYYAKNKEKIRQSATCQFCEHTFRDRSSLTTHGKRSMRCKLIRTQQRLAIAQLRLNELEANNIEASTSSVSSDAPPDILIHVLRDLPGCLE